MGREQRFRAIDGTRLEPGEVGLLKLTDRATVFPRTGVISASSVDRVQTRPGLLFLSATALLSFALLAADVRTGGYRRHGFVFDLLSS